MIINPDGLDLILYPTSDGHRWLTEEEFVSKWKAKVGIGTEGFISLLPDASDLMFADDTWLSHVASGVLTNQQAQMENFARAIGTTFYDKTVSEVKDWVGGTLEEFIPEIGKIASGTLAAIDLGGGISKEIGSALGGTGSATTKAIESAEIVMNAAIGAMSAIAVVNPIVGAVIAAGFGIAKAATHAADRAAAAEAAAAAARREAEDNFYLNLPDFPLFDKTGDQQSMRLVLEAMPSADWTNLYCPRYAPNKPWMGKMYKTGWAFGPGEREGGGKWGVNKYEADGGRRLCLGMIPGTQQITDLITSRITGFEKLVNTDPHRAQQGPAGDYFRGYLGEQDEYRDNFGRLIPVPRPTQVIDTGDYFPSSAQSLTFLWGNMQMQGASGNPDLYKVNMPHVSSQWRDYIGNGWDYLEEMCSFPTMEFDTGGDTIREMINQGIKTGERRRMMEAIHSCAVSCGIGAYRCNSNRDVITKAVTQGTNAREAAEWEEWAAAQACNVDVHSFPVPGQGNKCRESIYDSYLKDRIREAHQFQWKMLSASLVCAYVRESFSAFTPPSIVKDGGQAADLKEKLRSMRDHLLVRPDQWRYLVEENVPRGEDHRGGDWYTQLEAVGAFKAPGLPLQGTGGTSGGGYAAGGLGLSAGEGFKEPAPPLMDLVGRTPNQEAVPGPELPGGSKGKGGILLLGAAAAVTYFFMSKKRR